MKTSSIKSRLSLKYNRKLKIFIFFLIITTIIWFLLALSKTYVSSASFKLNYDNLPTNKLLHATPVSKINFTVESPGFTLLKYRIKAQKLNLDLKNMRKINNRYFIVPNTQLSFLNKQLPNDVKLIDSAIDTIFLNIGNTLTKKVAVNANLKVNFKLGYNFISDLEVKPDSILVTGPDNLLDTINEISTHFLELKDVSQTIDKVLNLLLPNKDKNLTFSQKNVIVFARVDKFTEGSFEIPVKIINEPDGVKVNPFPNQVEVVYQVALSNFNKINQNSFTVVFDYEQYQKDTLISHLTPVILQKSEFINSIKVNPTQIEFLIQK